MPRRLCVPQRFGPVDFPGVEALCARVGVPGRARPPVVAILQAFGEAYALAEGPPASPAALMKLIGLTTSDAPFKQLAMTTKLDPDRIRDEIVSLDHVAATRFVEVGYVETDFAATDNYTVLQAAAVGDGMTVPLEIARHYEAADGQAAVADLRERTRFALVRDVPFVSLDEGSSDRMLRTPAAHEAGWLGRISPVYALPREQWHWLGSGLADPEGIADAIGAERHRFFEFRAAPVLAYRSQTSGEVYLYASPAHGQEAVRACAALVQDVESLGASPLAALHADRYRLSPKGERRYRVLTALLLLACQWPMWSSDPSPNVKTGT